MKNSEKIDKYIDHIRNKEGLAECLELMDAGETEESIKCLEAKSNIDPEDPDIHFVKALAISKTEEWAKAIQCLTDGLKLDPNHEYGLLIRAEILREHGRLEFALKFYNKLINLYQGDRAYKISKAEILEELGRGEEAEKIYNELKVDEENGLGIDDPEVPEEIEEAGPPEPQEEEPLSQMEEEPTEPVQPLVVAKQETRKLFIRGVPVERTPIKEVSLYKEYDEIEEPDDATEMEEVAEGLLELSELDDNEIIIESLELLEDELLDDLDDTQYEGEEFQLQDGEPPEVDPDVLEEIDRVMIMKGRALSKSSGHNYEGVEKWREYADEANEKRRSPVSSLGIFCIVSIAIYLMYISSISLYNNLFVDFRTFDMIQNAFVFVLGFGALYGSVSVAKNSLVFDHFMDSVFETEVYPRLEPALEEVADVQARLELIEDRLERMNLNIVRYKKHPPVHDSPFLSISNRISMFLKFVIAINVTIGVMLYSIRIQGSFTPYVFTTLFVIWWVVITDEYKLWKNPVSWAWAILPVFAVPVISMLLWVVIDNALLIGLISAFLCLYAYGYFTWSRYYVEGTLPFDLHEADLEEVEGDPKAGSEDDANNIETIE